MLRDDGSVWWNLGDSYASHDPGGYRPGEFLNPDGRQGPKAQEGARNRAGNYRQAGLKSKDLMMVPARVALALQADGWWLRAQLPWVKRNGMPDSADDRPGTAVEQVYLLAKAKRYFWDTEAVKVDARWQRENNPDWQYQRAATNEQKHPGNRNGKSGGFSEWDASQGRNFRNSDLFIQSWQGLMLDEDGEPLALVVNPEQFKGSHFACVDEETEALTPQGWRLHGDLRDGDVIAAYNPNRLAVQWEQATFHRYPYDGELVAIEKRDSSQRLTPNHRCWVRRRDAAPTVVRADQLRPGMEVLTTADWRIDEDTTIGTNWAELTGWYIAEGSDNYPGLVRIYQSQSANPAKVDRIRQLLNSVRADYREKQAPHFSRAGWRELVTFTVRGGVARRLQALAPAKRMTPELAMLTRMDGEALLRGLIDGDGHRRADGRTSIIQKDKSSIDAMQMLALRLGYRANVRPHGGSGIYTLWLTQGDWLTLRGRNGAHVPIGREHYVGTVWCPSVPSMFWLARRDGKTFITGNTWPQKLVEPMVKASTSEWGVCPECAAPFERMTEKVATGRVRERVGGGLGTVERRKPLGLAPVGGTFQEGVSYTTVGWRPTCKHYTSKGGGHDCTVCGATGAPVVGRPEATRPQSKRALQLFEQHQLTDAHLLAMRAVGLGEGGADSSKNATTQTGTGKNTEEAQRLAAEAKAVLGGYAREFLLGKSGQIVGWRSTCEHELEPLTWVGPEPIPATVLDIFGGAGSTAIAAARLGRDSISIELSPAYAKLAEERIQADGGFMVDVQVEKLS